MCIHNNCCVIEILFDMIIPIFSIKEQTRVLQTRLKVYTSSLFSNLIPQVLLFKTTLIVSIYEGYQWIYFFFAFHIVLTTLEFFLLLRITVQSF